MPMEQGPKVLRSRTCIGKKLVISLFGKVSLKMLLIMNIDDLICVVGATDNIMLSSTIGRNKNLIPGERFFLR